MDEKLRTELKELTNLEVTGTLEDTQKPRLESLKLIEQVEKTTLEKSKKDLDSALAQKDHFRTKAEKAEADRIALEAQLNQRDKNTKGLDVVDYIDISASLEGLDQREKEKLASEHKLTGKPLKEIRESEDYSLWQSAYKQKVEKEKALNTSNKQFEEPRKESFVDKLRGASLAEKEKLLTEAGLYKTPRPRADRVDIGRK